MLVAWLSGVPDGSLGRVEALATWPWHFMVWRQARQHRRALGPRQLLPIIIHSLLRLALRRPRRRLRLRIRPGRLKGSYISTQMWFAILAH